MAPPDADEYETHRRQIEELKAELGTLRYSLSTIEQEKEMADARHRTEMEDQRRRAQEDFEKRTAAEAECAKMARQVESAREELNEVKDKGDGEKSAGEKRIREIEEENRALQEQIEDLRAEKDEGSRRAEKRVMDVQMELEAVQRAVQELEQESSARESVLQTAQAQVAEKDAQVGALEAEVLRLKAHTGDAETMAVIKTELSEQVQHIRRLEATNREQLAELRHLRQIHKAVEVVEEEKRSLLRKLEAADVVERELSEARIQRQRLEDERRAWTAYLEDSEHGGEDMRFDSPEEMARALVQERLTNASHIEKMGALRAEVAAHETTIRGLEEEKSNLKAEVERAGAAAVTESGDKARARLERQRALAAREVEYLRAQLRTFDAEDVTFQPEQHDQVRAQRIKELEDLADKYKEEVQTLHAELASLESTASSPAAAGLKRPREPSDDGPTHEQLGVLSRKNRTLQDEAASAQTRIALLEKEVRVTREQLASAKKQSKVRILAMRSNPTSDFEAVKTETLRALRRENEELLAQMRDPSAGRHAFESVPASTLDAAERRVQEARAETASAQKSAKRLKEVWTAKSLEFKEAIFSTLGWTVTFIPNGKMRVESVYCPSVTDEHENSIVFDGEKGTMKVGGGPRSEFAGRIADQIGFWVRERGCIPGFLAALTLEFYEEHTRKDG